MKLHLGKSKTAVDYHNEVASEFDAKYTSSYSFIERLTVWKYILAENKIKGRVLDLGCGSGTLSLYLANLHEIKEVIGLDGSTEMIDICLEKKKKGNIGKASFYVEQFPQVDLSKFGHFDLIVASSSLEYVEDLEGFLVKINNVLKENGTLVVSLPNRSSFVRKLEKRLYKYFRRFEYFKHVKNLYTRREFEGILERRRFSLKETYFDGKIKIVNNYLRFLPKTFTYTMIIYVATKTGVNETNTSIL